MRVSLFIIITLVVTGGLYSIFVNKPGSSIKSKTGSRVGLPIEEINITSERYMFSPMLVRLKKGKTVKLVLTTYDVQHGLFQPDLKLNLEAYPGKPAETIITPDKTGEFTVACALYCGSDHDKMKMSFIVE